MRHLGALTWKEFEKWVREKHFYPSHDIQSVETSNNRDSGFIESEVSVIVEQPEPVKQPM